MPPKRKSTAKQAEEEEELKRQAELEEARQQGIQTAKSRNQPDIDSLDFPTKVKQNIQEALNSCETLEDETISVESLPAILQVRMDIACFTICSVELLLWPCFPETWNSSPNGSKRATRN